MAKHKECASCDTSLVPNGDVIGSKKNAQIMTTQVVKGEQGNRRAGLSSPKKQDGIPMDNRKGM